MAAVKSAQFKACPEVGKRMPRFPNLAVDFADVLGDSSHFQ